MHLRYSACAQNYDPGVNSILPHISDVGWFSRHHNFTWTIDCTSEDVSNGPRLLRCPGSESVGMQKHLSVRYILNWTIRLLEISSKTMYCIFKISLYSVSI